MTDLSIHYRGIAWYGARHVYAYARKRRTPRRHVYTVKIEATPLWTELSLLVIAQQFWREAVNNAVYKGLDPVDEVPWEVHRIEDDQIYDIVLRSYREALNAVATEVQDASL